MRALLLASATTAFCQPMRARSGTSHCEILSLRLWPSIPRPVRLHLAADLVGSHLVGDWQHLGVPGQPIGAQLLEPLGFALRQVGAFALVLREVEQELVAGGLQVFPVAVAHRALGVGLVAPEQLALHRRGLAQHLGQQVAAVARVVGVGRGAGSGQQRGQPVHADQHLIADLAGLHARGPAQQRGHADAAFQQLALLATEGPDIGEALAAVVAGEHDDGVLRQALGLQRGQHAAHGSIQRGDDLAVLLQVAAVGVVEVLELARHRFVAWALPRPVRRGEVQAQQEGLGRTLAAQEGLAVVGDQVGVVAHLVDPHLALEQVRGQVGADAGLVGEIVHRAAGVAKELVVAALQRTELGQGAEVPFAEQRGAVAAGLQQRGQGGVLGWQAELVAGAGNRLLQPAAQPVLVAAGDQAKARGRAHGRVGIALREADALGGQLVEVGRGVVALAVDAEVGPAQVVGQDKEDVGRRVGGARRGREQGKGAQALQQAASGRGRHHEKITGNDTCTSSAPPAVQRMRFTAACTYL
mmetsp:Transcript_67487/g.186944  ORF Transcript_67487/g.186944 Transcript_67487/m.186944 type:complete len:527 (-) Transcript_67487:101-1681(-)